MATEQARQPHSLQPHSGSSQGVTGQAQEAASQAKEQVQEKAQAAKGQATQRLRTQLDERSTALGTQASQVSEALRKAAEHLDGEGNGAGARAARSAAGQVEQLADYLRNSSSDRFLSQLEGFGRRRPWAAGGIGAAIGFVAARFLKASSESRYESTRRSDYDASMPISRDQDATGPLGSMPPEQRAGYWSG